MSARPADTASVARLCADRSRSSGGAPERRVEKAIRRAPAARGGTADLPCVLWPTPGESDLPANRSIQRYRTYVCSFSGFGHVSEPGASALGSEVILER